MRPACYFGSEYPYATSHSLTRIAGLVDNFGVYPQEARLSGTFPVCISDGQRKLTVKKEQRDIPVQCLEISATSLNVVYRDKLYSEYPRIASE